jgi:hypothetical protein
MTRTNKTQTIALCLILFFQAFALTLTYAATEDNYTNDPGIFPGIYESTHAEGNYKVDIIINPDVTGIYANENNYKLDLTINPNPVGGLLSEGNYKLDIIPQKSFPEQHGISTTNILTSKTIVGQGYTVTIKITLTNHELNYETVHIKIYANTTTIHTQTVMLPSKGTTVVTFAWNTIDFAKGNYTISATATPIPGETYTADNTRIDGTVKVTIPCDANGDGKVNVFDLFNLGKAYGSTPPMPNWNPNTDFNENNQVDSSDLSDLGQNYG